MTRESLPPDELESWLYLARQDLLAASVLLREGLPREALFHCQQAAEKALKGFLTGHGKPFPKIHDLSELRPICGAIDLSLDPLLAEADDLTAYAVRFRYPGAPYEPDASQAEEALQLATRVVDEIQRRLTPPLDEAPAPQQS
jgi:HEPN domain-containing protein